MKAALLTSFGGPDAVTITDIPQPDLGAGGVRVSVEAASLGPWDAQAANGYFTALGGLATFPQQIGWDFAGSIQATSPEVRGFAVGDRVCGFIPQPWMGTGAAAEAITLPAELLSHTPDLLDSVTAATLPVALLTADIAFTTAQTARGSTILILGATGGVGSFVTQLAARQGIIIAASVSPKSFDEARALGARVVLKSRSQGYDDWSVAVHERTAQNRVAGPGSCRHDGALAGNHRNCSRRPTRVLKTDGCGTVTNKVDLSKPFVWCFTRQNLERRSREPLLRLEALTIATAA